MHIPGFVIPVLKLYSRGSCFSDVFLCLLYRVMKFEACVVFMRIPGRSAGFKHCQFLNVTFLTMYLLIVRLFNKDFQLHRLYIVELLFSPKYFVFPSHIKNLIKYTKL
jgi:hypothetical protein